MSQPAARPAPQRFGRYMLLELIGKGGMAEVFRAVSQGVEGFQRVFVVKRILRDKSASKDFVEMFINEARISALLNHPNIVQVYDFGQIEGSFFLAMEYLHGKDLLSVLRELHTRGRVMPPEIAAYVAHQVIAGLHHAHSLKQHGGKSLDIVHRDVSPSNIMLLRAGGVKLLDFGIAKAATEVEEPRGTQTGTVKGKLSYLSPEQVRGENPDGRSDIFSLGVVLWESLTGKRLFFDKTDYQTMKNVLERPVPPPSTQRFDLPPQLDYIVVRALERELAQRYPSARVMSDDLESYLGQAGFSPSSLPKLLDDLFGEDPMKVEAQIPMDPLPPPEPTAAGGMAFEPTRSATPSVPPPAPERFDSKTGGVGATVVVNRGGKRRAAIVIGVLAAGLAGAGFVLKKKVPGGVTALFGPPAGPGTSGATTASAPGATPPVGSGPGGSAARPAAGVAMVSIRLETDPKGAEVRGPHDTVIGMTPTTATFPKSTEPVTLVFNKPGYLAARHAIVPDRDVTALVTLRIAPRTKASAPSRAEPEPEIKIIPEPTGGAAAPAPAAAPVEALPTAAGAAPAELAPSEKPKTEPGAAGGAAPDDKKKREETIDPFAGPPK